jgi:hypothetical protein
VDFALGEDAAQLDAVLRGFSTRKLADHVGDGHQAAVFLVLKAPVAGGGFWVP